MTPVDAQDPRAVAAASLEILRSWRTDFIELVSALALAESPSTVPESQTRVRGILEDVLTDLAFDVERVAGRQYGDHILAKPRAGQAAQLLLGHFDTVWALGTLETMPVVAEGDVLRGPGVFDMKGGLGVGIFALRALRELGITPTLPPGFLITAEEEIGSPESEPLIIDLAKHVQRVFVLEPALGREGLIKTTRKGVGHFHVIVRGVSAHAGLAPRDGASAIAELAEVIGSLTAMTDHDRGITVNVGVVEGGTRANVVAAVATAQVDVRVRTVADARWIEAEFAKLSARLPGTTLEITGAVERDPMERTPRNEVLWGQAVDIASGIDVQLDEGESGGASDGNFTSQYTATLDGLGAVGDGAHAAHEFLSIDRTLERAAILTGLLALPSA